MRYLLVWYGFSVDAPPAPCRLTIAPRQIVFIQQITWGLSIGLIILSILLFYFRLFPHTWMPKAVYIVGTWDVVWTVCTLIITVNQCIPIHFIWNHEPHDAKCINVNAFYFASGMISTLTILTVLFLPLPIICKLQVSGTKKVGLGISFTVGALYVTSLYR